jgi:hypothetical protein
MPNNAYPIAWADFLIRMSQSPKNGSRLAGREESKKMLAIIPNAGSHASNMAGILPFASARGPGIA